MITAVALILSYLIGSIPTAYLAARIIKGIDIRDHGSGNVGATNALRVIGVKSGVGVLLFDLFKGAVCVSFLADYFYTFDTGLNKTLLMYMMGLATIIGHDWSVFLRFKGGKGVATTLGVLLAMSFYIPEFRMALLILIGVWFLIMIFTRLVSLGSIVLAVSLPVIFYIFWLLEKTSLNAVYFALIACILIIVRHRENIHNLIHRQERPIV
jgi:glycerol-3-phosphate acyltransferase PlsY